MSDDRSNARELILSAAVQVLQDEGPAQLTQTRVAKVAGLRQGHLTYYFPRKADLWMATAERAHDEMERELAGLFTSTGIAESTEDMRTKFVHMLTKLVQSQQRTRMMLSLVLQGHSDSELMDLVRANVDRSRMFLGAALGARYSPAVVELTMAALWGLGMRDLGAREGQDCESLNLVGALFDMLENGATSSSE